MKIIIRRITLLCAIILLMSGYAYNANAEEINYMSVMVECAQDNRQVSLEEGQKYENLRNEKIELSGGRYPKTHFFSESTDGNYILQELAKYQAHYDNCENFMEKMIELAGNGDVFSIELGQLYENRRNQKINENGSPYDKTYFFTDYVGDSGKIQAELTNYLNNEGRIKKPSAYAYSEEELYRFTQLMCAEMGSSWIPREEIEWTASVVVNQIDHWYYGNNLWDVITNANVWYPNQVGTWNKYNSGTFERFDEIHEICRDVLDNGSKIPSDVVYVAQFKQGSSVWAQRYDSVLGGTHYWCRW